MAKFKSIPDYGSIKELASSSSALLISGEGRTRSIGLDASGLAVAQAATVAATYVAGEPISALKAVYEFEGAIYLANPSNLIGASVIGIALNAAGTGAPVEVLQYGPLHDASFSFSPASLLFVTSGGTISTVAPTEGYLTRLGRAINSNTVLIIIENPITL